MLLGEKMLLGPGRKVPESFNCDAFERRPRKSRDLIDKKYLGSEWAAALTRASSAVELAFP